MKRLFVVFTGVAIATLPVACKKAEEKKAPAAETKPAEPKPEEKPEEKPAEVETADTKLEAPVGVNLADIQWQDGPPSLPKGAKFALLEGDASFPAGKTFTLALKFPKNYAIPAHSHPATERVTVLDGAVRMGHGDKADKKQTTEVKQGGVVIMPAGHTHFLFTDKAEATISLQGVGPWAINYVDPKNDPRQPPPAKVEPMADSRDAAVEAMIVQAADVKFAPAPEGMLPPGAELAVLEGDPAQPKTFTLRIKVPDGYKFPVHTHTPTDRPTVLTGALMFAMGDEWKDADLKEMKAGAMGILPTGMNHYAVAKGETVFQVFGVGPFDILWKDPNAVSGGAAPAEGAAKPAEGAAPADPAKPAK